MTKASVWVGFDGREGSAFAVTRTSARKNLHPSIRLRAVVLDELRAQGLYYRPTGRRDGRLWDEISQAPMSTEFAISRFLVPHLAARQGYAVFMDGDMLVREDLDLLFGEIDPRKAVSVVKHEHAPPAGLKMDGQLQTLYARKNWSSLMVFNCEHPANKALTVDLVNTVPGRDLHAFCWLEDHQIGALHPAWNWLAGWSDPAIDPKIVHYTDGAPCFAGYEDAPYADEWRQELRRWAA